VDNTIKVSGENSRFLRNINTEDVQDCFAVDGVSLKTIYKKALEEGIVNSVFTVPTCFGSIFHIPGAYNPKYPGRDAFIVSLKTTAGMVSIFNPSIYRSLLIETRKYTTATKYKMLSPGASWGSPIMATYQDNLIDELRIIDVMPKTLKVVEKLYDTIAVPNLFFDKPYELTTDCVPSERMILKQNHYNQVFWCPPYFSLELYPGEEQSTEQYKTYEEWLEGYWRPTVINCYNAMEAGGVFSFVMGNKIENRYLYDDMLEIAKEYFTYKDEIKMIPPQEASRKSNQAAGEKYEVCSIMVK
jgi:hypothetical protein